MAAHEPSDEHTPSLRLQGYRDRPAGTSASLPERGVELALIPRLEGIRRLGISVSTFEDWSNSRSPRFKSDLPKLYGWPGRSRAKFFRSDELAQFIHHLTC